MSDGINLLANGTFGEEMKSSANKRLIGLGAGAVLGMVGGHFLGLGAWKATLVGGAIGFLVSKLT